MTPLGVEVEPEVYCRNAMESPVTLGCFQSRAKSGIQIICCQVLERAKLRITFRKRPDFRQGRSCGKDCMRLRVLNDRFKSQQISV